jgi:hypothetical protein
VGSGHPHYLLAALNHPIAEAFVRTNTSPFRGGYYSHGKQFIQPIPIARPSGEQAEAVERLVGGLLAIADQLEAARTPRDRTGPQRRAVERRRQLESVLSDVYGLSAADVNLARDVPVPA